MNGLNAGTDSVNRGSNSLSAMLMQRFGAEGTVQGASDAQRSSGDATFRSLLKDRMARTGTEPDAGETRRTLSQTDRPASVGRTAERSAHQGAAMSASQAGRRRVDAAQARPDTNRSAQTQADDQEGTGSESQKTTTGKAEMAQADVRTPEGRIKVKVKAQDAGEILSEIVASMLEAIRAAAGETAQEETGTGENATETATDTASTFLAATAEGAAGTEAAALLETLEGLLRQADGSTSGAGASTEADAFLERLAALLQKAGVDADSLKSLTLRVKTDDGAKLLLKLQSLADGLRRALEGAAAAAAPAAEAQGDAVVPVSGMEAPIEATAANAGQDAARDGAGQDGAEAEGRDRHMPTAFAAAVPDQAAQGVKTAQMAQGTGVHAAAASSHGAFGQRVSELAQTKQAVTASPLADPESAKNVTSQVLTRIQTVSGDEKHEMELQLKPESLGKINLRVIEEKGQVLARFTAESQQVKSILESNMQLLKDALEKNGLNVAQLSVSVGQQGNRRNDGEAGRDQGAGVAARSGSVGTTGITGSLEGGGTLAAAGAGLSARVREYLYGPDSTISLRA